MHKYVRFALVMAVSAAGLRAQTSLGLQNLQTTGIVGLASTQTAQINLLNPGVQAPALGVICSATVSFIDDSAKVLKSKTLTVIPGQSQSFAIQGDTDVNLASGQRTQIRVTIGIPPYPPPSSASGAAATACKVIPTLEIFDTATGRTLVTMGHVETIPSIFATTTQRN